MEDDRQYWAFISYSHTDEIVDQTIAAVAEALVVYGHALEDGVDRYLEGPSVKPVNRTFS